ncbi:MAG: family 78 glycoside hydrolase catalytic domain [Duncaniella sp.]|nr:family 78 glycoside hydrolase catalytic domain [Duncaniella sp.]
MKCIEALWRSFVLFLCIISAPLSAMSAVGLKGLSVERLVRPLGVEISDPRFGWIITSDQRGVVQTAYHILVASSPDLLAPGKADVWDSGRVASDESVLVPYAGRQLMPNRRYYWRVKVSTNRGDSDWSDVAEWGTGPMGEVGWRGRWIGWEAPFGWDVASRHSRLSSRYLRKEFKAEDKAVKRATVHVSGLGLYELYINGERVGDYVLTPAPTDYRRTVLYDSYDVTDLMRGGGEDNAIGVALGNGRYYTMHQNYKPHKIVNFGYPKVRLNLTIEYADGSTQRIATDESWRLTADGPIRSNNEYDGEVYDARRELGDWTRAGYDDSQWLYAQRAALPYGSLRPSMSPGMKVKQRMSPRTVRRTPRGTLLVDFGQNMAGWVGLRLPRLAEGDTVRVRYAERITPDSLALDVENLRSSESTDTYIANGREEGCVWTPRFVYHGFQYVEIDGVPEVSADDITAMMVYDDLEDAGTFECSSRVINDVYRAARMGIASNYKGVPVDCPQRDERQPWTGDHNMGAWGENFIFDNATLMAKWTDDMREAQREDGCLPDICPAFYNYYTADMTWSSTLPVVCDMLYEQTGDRRHIERNYEATKRWMRFIRRHYTRDGLITADKYGDWCVPPESPELIHTKDPARKTDGTLIASAYYYKMCGLMAKFARVLGLDGEAGEWDADGQKVKEAFNNRFLNRRPATSQVPGHILYPDSTCYDNGTLTANLLPLAFDMVPEEYRQTIADNIIKTIITDNGGRISCGVIGVNWLMRELSRMGRGDVAEVLASNTAYPSYGYMLSKGATTIWELWNGDTASRAMNSCNHVMLLGDLIAWMYRDLGGINPAAPGYKEILLSPDFSIDKLTYARATYNTPYGLVESAWRKNPMRLEWTVEVPCNASALISLPASAECDTTKAPCDGLTYAGTDSDGRKLWRAMSGRYNLDVALDPSVGQERTGIVTDEFLYDEASFPECHGSTIAELPDGTLVAAFFGGTKERNPDCCIWVCRKPKGAEAWTAPVIAADGVFRLDDPHIRVAGLTGIDSTTTVASAGPIGPHFSGDIADARRKACWNPVLFLDPESGELMLFYKIGSRVGDWTGWLTRSTDGGVTWSEREPLPEGILGPIKNKPELIGGRLLCPSSREGKGWRAVMEYTDDMGKTWHSTGFLPSDSAYMTRDLDRLQPIYAIQPSVLRHPDGRLQILCRTRNSRLATAWSDDNGATWSNVTLCDVANNNSGTDAVTLADGRHVLVYNDFATIPGTPKGPRTPLNVAVSDDGLDWQRILTLEDSPVSQYSYPSVIEGRDGTIHIVYTWRRQRIKHVAVRLPEK